ncbi:MAG: 2-succinyl-5-enolpyruvyl-6-hydroxy-3-cyclohexene-1-carboxylic-acid synthase, partial [Gemmatimonadetes bacterium]|nr:2-succinyl-5-enolpyruvyl-6-hydroxy-3-cyclohexene-1-carboxylic-acid synthase [Gemmatimonadota bacterium]
PGRLRDADANQVIDQRSIFGSYPVWATELPAPSVDDASLRHLRVAACRAVGLACGLPAGPVHLNLPYAKPLEPVRVAGGRVDDATEPRPEHADDGGTGRRDGSPWTRVTVRRPRLSDDELGALAEHLASFARPVIVAGPHPDSEALGPALRGLARAWGPPLLADPLSGARYGTDDGTPACTAYDLFLRARDVGDALEPDAIVRVGAAPTSAPLLAWMDRHSGAEHVVVDAGRRWKDHLARADRVVQACAVDTVGRLVGSLRPLADRTWTDRWSVVDDAVRTSLDAAREGVEGAHEGRLARAVLRALPEDGTLFVSSSMPVRDLDGYGGPAAGAARVYGNRGASGIDGIVSTALGAAAGSETTAVALVGDLAFLHDVNGLLAAREADAAVVFVVVNNDGGGIFHMLPIREHEPAFTPFFATPHGVDLQHGAALYGVPHAVVQAANLESEVRLALEVGHTRVIEVRSDRDENRRGHESAARRAQEAARQALSGA